MEEANRGLVDLMSWYNFATFDIIADLTFGEPFYCLRDSDYHPWVRMVFDNVRATSRARAMDIAPSLKIFSRNKAQKKRTEFMNFVQDKVTKRLASEHVRPDFMTYATKYQDEKGLTDGELHSNANLFLIAGSETTATMLSGTTYSLLRNPDKLRLLIKETRDNFKSMDEITIDGVSKLPYLNAVINEGLRMYAFHILWIQNSPTDAGRYPPVPTGFPRKVPAGGDTISGYWLPEDVSVQSPSELRSTRLQAAQTSVYVSQYATNHSERNFTEPDSFAPERWLDDPKFANDKKTAAQPFSYGPRNCLGKKYVSSALDGQLEIANMLQSRICRNALDHSEDDVELRLGARCGLSELAGSKGVHSLGEGAAQRAAQASDQILKAALVSRVYLNHGERRCYSPALLAQGLLCLNAFTIRLSDLDNVQHQMLRSISLAPRMARGTNYVCTSISLTCSSL